MVIRLLVLGLFILSPLVGFGDSFERKKLSNQLKNRKKAFDLYLESKQKRKVKKISTAHSQKEIRKKSLAGREAARRQFKRKKEIFSRKVYQRFLARRELKKKKMKKAYRKYIQKQKELEKISRRKEYRIDGKKEFDL